MLRVKNLVAAYSTASVHWLELVVFCQLFADKGADLTPMVSTTMAHPTYAAVTGQ